MIISNPPKCKAFLARLSNCAKLSIRKECSFCGSEEMLYNSAKFPFSIPTLNMVTLSSLSFKAKGTGSFPVEKPSVMRKMTFLLCFRADLKMSWEGVIE